jgi:hypothetical protein
MMKSNNILYILSKKSMALKKRAKQMRPARSRMVVSIAFILVCRG